MFTCSPLLSFLDIVQLPWEESTFDKKDTCFVFFHTAQTVFSVARLKITHFICLRKLLSCKAFGYYFLFALIIPTTLIYISFNSCKRGMLVKKLSMCNTVSLVIKLCNKVSDNAMCIAAIFFFVSEQQKYLFVPLKRPRVHQEIQD